VEPRKEEEEGRSGGRLEERSFITCIFHKILLG
jgi:hypothetical protein